MTKSMRYLTAFAAGFVFAIGLGLSGMTQPAKVVGFLDFFGSWDPTLAFVMGGAVVVYALAFRLITRRKVPIVEDVFRLPTKTELDPRLISGAVLFGVGWGLAGYCPGPGITAAGSGSSAALIFAVSMVVGMGGFELFETIRERRQTRAAQDAPDSKARPARQA